MAKILIVEDNQGTNKAICEYMKEAGHTLFSAYTGSEALKIFRGEELDIIVLDIMLPEMSGIVVLHEIRKVSNIPVIMLTALLKSAKSDYTKAAAELDTLRAEVIKALRGESAFSQELLSSLIADGEKKCLTIQRTMEAAQAAYDEGQVMLDALNAQYDDIISWADMYDSASMESKKMIVSCLIRRVEVYRDYRLHIDFNIDFEQFSAGLDISAIAA